MLDNNFERVPIRVVCHTISSQTNIMMASKTKPQMRPILYPFDCMFVDHKESLANIFFVG